MDGQRHQRSELAARWTPRFANYILDAAQRTLVGREGEQGNALGEEGATRTPEEGWEAYPVAIEEGVLAPEEVLHRQLKQMGAEGERYDYILFEGEARMLPRRVRATLAHLHVAT